MDKHLSLRKYRLIDLAIFTVLLSVFEIIAVRAVGWFGELYSISFLIAISSLVMMRWGAWSAVTLAAGALAYCWANDAVLENYIIYVCGNLFMLFNLFWFMLGKDKVRKGYFALAFVLSGYLLIELGRAIVAAFFGTGFVSAFIGFLGTDAVNALLALLVIVIAKRQNGLFEDQISYLKRLNEEERNHRGVI
ncbi:MAG TPA: hypothetical protein VIK96_01080 [Bacilli bacterium]